MIWTWPEHIKQHSAAIGEPPSLADMIGGFLFCAAS